MRFTFLAAAMLVFLPGPVVADGCDDYAAQAVADVVQAEQLGCAGLASDEDFLEGPVSFVGPRWSTDPTAHANWCRAHGGETSPYWWDHGATMPQSEEAQRQRAMLFCTVCNVDATEAAQQGQAAFDLHCGFTGDEWDNRFAAQMAACFKQGFSSFLFVLWSNMRDQNRDHAKKLAACKQNASLRAKLSVPREPSLADKARIPRDLSDPNCLRCKSKSNVKGVTQQGGGSAMDRLGDLNNSNLGTVSGNAGGAQIGRPATPSPTSPKTSAPPSADAVEPSRSNPSVFISKPSPTFNNSNTIR